MSAINKPPAISSAQVIRDVQEHFNPSKLFRPWLEREHERNASLPPQQQKRRKWKGRKQKDVKMGHGGTLDPMATGVLILGVGAGTKELGHFSTECTKSYETVVLFGAATDTYDTEGKIVGRKAHQHITKDQVEQALAQFRGKGMQKPPIFSALRVQGKRLYEYAREGKPLPDGYEIEERSVEVSELEMMEWYPGGTHQWHWPDREADTSEKKLAEQALHIESDAAAIAANGDSSAKRKRDEHTEDGAPTEPSPKRSKADAEIASAPAGSNPMPATIKRLSTAEGGQPDTEVTQPPKDDAQPATSDTPLTTKPSEVDIEAEPKSKPESEPQSTATTQIQPCPAPAVRLRMTVTSGFYVRSLCHDLGAAVGSLAMMSELSRTRQSDFDLKSNVLQYEDLKQGEEVWGPKVQKLLEEWQARKAEKG
ncbi:tRNA pseudouridine synthase 4 [Pseudocercospora fuligena]|uniref:tRNA pseudouridine(55) synthase n=1 Tax=Pseudocercospora fuligena TaxID=685502 RepID=A0A8H6RP52_9PEZI|nr:tRNA pseudouridine synthase 4 [Pseudocercospora fuligena]